MADKRNSLGYLLAALVGAAAGIASVIGFFGIMPRMMANCMKKMKEEGVEPPECCKEMMKDCCTEPGTEKKSAKKRKK